MQTFVSIKRKRNPWLLVTSILALAVFAAFIIFCPPTMVLQIASFHIPVFPLFFVLLSTFLFSFISYLFKSLKHGVLVFLFVVIYLIFRITNLTHPFFLILLIALFLTLELLVSYRK